MIAFAAVNEGEGEAVEVELRTCGTVEEKLVPMGLRVNRRGAVGEDGVVGDGVMEEVGDGDAAAGRETADGKVHET